MNKLFQPFGILTLLALAVGIPGLALAQHRPGGMLSRHPGASAETRTVLPLASPTKEVVKTDSGEQFFIIASIDKQNSELLLKRPTEVTELVKVDPKSKYFNAKGQPVEMTHFRAGDTVWAKISTEKGDPKLISMREGEMTVSDLHRYYLDYRAIK